MVCSLGEDRYRIPHSPIQPVSEELAMVYLVAVFGAREEFSPSDEFAGLWVFTYLIATVTTWADKALGWILS